MAYKYEKLMSETVVACSSH